MKRYLLLLLISSLLVIPLIFIRKYSFSASFVITFLIYFSLTFTLLRKRISINYIYISLIPYLFLIFYLHVLNFRETLISLPSTLAPFFGALFAFLIFKLKAKALKISFSILIMIFMAFIYLNGYNIWSKSINNYVYHNNISGYVDEISPKNIVLLNNESQNIKMDSLFNTKLVILDFWFLNCKPCFEEFPNFERLYDKYGEKIDFYTINIPYGNDGFDKLKTSINEYSFPKLYAKDKDVANLFGVKVYPVILIIFKGKIIYRGNLYGAEIFLKEKYPNFHDI